MNNPTPVTLLTKYHVTYYALDNRVRTKTLTFDRYATSDALRSHVAEKCNVPASEILKISRLCNV